MTATSETAQVPVPSAWAPLRIATFRSLWLALPASNIGTWMQPAGAQWLLVEQHAGRLTGADREVEERAPALADSPPEVGHLLSAR